MRASEKDERRATRSQQRPIYLPGRLRLKLGNLPDKTIFVSQLVADGSFALQLILVYVVVVVVVVVAIVVVVVVVVVDLECNEVNCFHNVLQMIGFAVVVLPSPLPNPLRFLVNR